MVVPVPVESLPPPARYPLPALHSVRCFETLSFARQHSFTRVHTSNTLHKKRHARRPPSFVWPLSCAQVALAAPSPMLLSWLVATGIAATAQDVVHYSRDNATFLHQVWEFFMHSTLNAPLAEWVPVGNWMEEKAQVLALEENYAFVVDHFCESVNVSSIPNTTGLTLAKRPRWLKVPYVAGCPMNDPSFAEQGQHLMLATGLGCFGAN